MRELIDVNAGEDQGVRAGGQDQDLYQHAAGAA